MRGLLKSDSSFPFIDTFGKHLLNVAEYLDTKWKELINKWAIYFTIVLTGIATSSDLVQCSLWICICTMYDTDICWWLGRSDGQSWGNMSISFGWPRESSISLIDTTSEFHFEHKSRCCLSGLFNCLNGLWKKQKHHNNNLHKHHQLNDQKWINGRCKS